MLSEEEKKAIEWLKNKPDECTNIINSSSYIGNKKAYAKERTNFKTVFNLITKLQKENKEKDKQIDLMAEYIFESIDVEEDICNSAYVECKQEIAQDITCIKCIKQYFKSKAEKE